MLFVGIDHSLTAFGLAAVRPNWGLDFRRVFHTTFETKPTMGPDAVRRAALARDAVERVRRLAEQWDVDLTDVRVAIEGGILNARDVFTIRSQERLVGVTEHEFQRVLGLQVTIPEQRTIRTTFMGKSLSGGRGAGDAAQELLRAFMQNPLDWREGELDAFLVANHELSLAGEAFVCCAPAVEPQKRRARRRKAA